MLSAKPPLCFAGEIMHGVYFLASLCFAQPPSNAAFTANSQSGHVDHSWQFVKGTKAKSSIPFKIEA